MSEKMTKDTHPLNGWIKAVTLDTSHAGFNTALLEAKNPTRLLLIWRRATSHGVRIGSELRMATSYDMGVSFAEERSIYLESEWDTRNFVSARMANGRLGILCTRLRLVKDGPYGIGMAKPFFLYSDDEGASWQTSEIEFPRPQSFVGFYGNIISCPTTASRHDDQGFAAFSYSTPHKVIDGLYTKDNGESWQWEPGICTSDGILAQHLTEMWVERLGDENQWIMVARPTTAGHKGNAVAYFSCDMRQWEGPYDTGLDLSGNAPCLVVENDIVYFYTVSRRGHKREISVRGLQADGNIFVYAKAPVKELIAAKGRFADFGNWQKITALPEAATGYIFPRKIRDFWIAAVNCGETPPFGTHESNSNFLALITPNAPVIVDAPAWRNAQVQENQIDNGDFSIWNRGEHFKLSGEQSYMTADRWRIQASVQDEILVERRSYRHPTRGMKNDWFGKSCEQPSGRSAHQTVQRIADIGLCAGKRVTIMIRAADKTLGSLASIKLRHDYGHGGDASEEFEFARDIPLTPEPLFYSFSYSVPTIDEKKTGPDAAIELIIEERSVGDNSSYDMLYGDVILTIWPTATRVRMIGRAEQSLRCARYFQSIPLRVSATGIGEAGILRFHALPKTDLARLPVLRLIATDGSENGQIRLDSGAMVPVFVEKMEVDGVSFVAGMTFPGMPAGATVIFDAERNLPAEITIQPEVEDSSIVRGTAPDGTCLWMAKNNSKFLAVPKINEPAFDASIFFKALQDERRLIELERQLLDALLAGSRAPAELVEERRQLVQARQNRKEWGTK